MAAQTVPVAVLLAVAVRAVVAGLGVAAQAVVAAVETAARAVVAGLGVAAQAVPVAVLLAVAALRVYPHQAAAPEEVDPFWVAPAPPVCLCRAAERLAYLSAVPFQALPALAACRQDAAPQASALAHPVLVVVLRAAAMECPAHRTGAGLSQSPVADWAVEWAGWAGPGLPRCPVADWAVKWAGRAEVSARPEDAAALSVRQAARLWQAGLLVKRRQV
jgi:hypothetical protein